MQKQVIRTRSRVLLVTLLTSLLAISGVQYGFASYATAVSAQDFQPGNIIDDATFYDGSAMSAADIQTFLNGQVTRCTIGDPGRLAGTPWGTTTIASLCLRDFKTTTLTKTSNSYCGAYVGAVNESAAQIIYKASQACGISPKVLLVMLEKEQSLVSDSWPTVRQFDVAMGYACPDSGPDYSANCDSTYSGFQNQVYRAAWQLKVYRAFPDSYNYKPFVTNTIQWHPNPSCGTSGVFIENWATAALYIYTPYRPNQAALNAGWGLGDSCSSYGNRNFFLLYSTWFGSTHASDFPVIDAKFAENPWLGSPTTGYITQSHNGGGALRAYENGAITQANGSARAYVVSGDFRDFYNAEEGTAGWLGWPTTDVTNHENGGSIQGYQNGVITHMPTTGFATLSGKIREYYNLHVYSLDGPLGWPLSGPSCSDSQNCTQDFEYGTIALTNNIPSFSITEMQTIAASNSSDLGAAETAPIAMQTNGWGVVQAFQHGAIAWAADHGAHVISGSIRIAFNNYGGLSGTLGWPTGDAMCDTAGACQQSFVGGTLYVASDGAVSMVSAAILLTYEQLGGASGSLGTPVGSTNTIAAGKGGTAQGFTNGAIADSPRTGAFAITSPIRERFNGTGGLAGELGWPTGNASSIMLPSPGFAQGFEGGAITSSSSGTFVLTGEFRTKFTELGGLDGTLGWPASEQIRLSTKNGSGIVQSFDGGAIAQRNGGGTFVITQPIRDVFNASGGIGGEPGWPQTDPIWIASNGGGFVQAFQNSAVATSANGTFSIRGEIRNYFNLQGGIDGTLGWPTSAESCIGVNCEQSFQGGTIIWDTSSNSGQVRANQ